MRARSAVQVSALPAIASSAEPALEETRRTLLGIVHRRFGAVPESVIVEHVVRWTEGADFVVRKAALEALLRRRAFALRDSLRVTARPARSAVLGEYSTSRPSDSKGRRASRRGLEPRPYQTELQSLAPLVGSCSCPDFTRSSLGLCKHLLVVLGDVYASRKRVEMALAKRKGRPGPRLDWDPGLPLLGELDRSRGLVWTEGARGVTAGRGAFVPRWRRSGARWWATASQRVGSPGPSVGSSCSGVSSAWSRRSRSPQRPGRSWPKSWNGPNGARFAERRGGGRARAANAGSQALSVPTRGHAETVDGSPAERAARYASREPGFLILNYEQLLRDLEAIRAIEPELVVLDEAQRIKNYATKTATYVKRLAPTYRLVLTGTPFENHLEELASVLDWVDDVALALFAPKLVELRRLVDDLVGDQGRKVLEQRIGRIYRLGQQRPIDVYNLVSEQGIESRIAGLVAAKQALFSGLFDGQSDAVRFDAAGSFLSRIQQLVEPSPVLEATEGPEEAELDDDDQDIGSTEDAEMAEAELPDESDGAASKRSARNGRRGEPSPEGPPSGVRQHPTAQLFAQLSVERTKSGGVRIEAPKEAAASLLALFDGMAKLMSGVVNDR